MYVPQFFFTKVQVFWKFVLSQKFKNAGSLKVSESSCNYAFLVSHPNNIKTMAILATFYKAMAVWLECPSIGESWQKKFFLEVVVH